ncbi:PTS fructose-like transporter subunit IIB [Corallococcus llansteffanensis]|uniref:protein-N(pi)-phosphohistidine--D-fructose phosphotransferase n=1 Tax=Corallococcus llansteffanensis TaxID=2316731 RepID=A0A3A8P9L0_9BACT|nr:PTS fructose-like transporter subunit IIB [Corallococcus llansteffanensis]RKH49142.1 PTS fructose-like transporter subunit IIB [Corallococcus llansteffanensis]
MAKLVAVTACPTGIAHTFMAAEALRRVADLKGHDLTVETQGGEGVRTPLEEQAVAQADAVILATDITVDESRFHGKPLVRTSTAVAIRDTERIIDEAVARATLHRTAAATEAGAATSQDALRAGTEPHHGEAPLPLAGAPRQGEQAPGTGPARTPPPLAGAPRQGEQAPGTGPARTPPPLAGAPRQGEQAPSAASGSARASAGAPRQGEQDPGASTASSRASTLAGAPRQSEPSRTPASTPGASRRADTSTGVSFPRPHGLLTDSSPPTRSDAPRRAEPGAEPLRTPPSSTPAGTLVAVTACPTGIAHTFMAAEALTRAARAKGYAIRVETQGSVGAKNTLTPEEIAQADAVIIGADTHVSTERFAGKRLLQTSVGEALKQADRVVEQALALPEPADTARPASALPTGAGVKAEPAGAYKHLLTGVSFMLPFVVAGGLLLALSFVFGIDAYKQPGTLPAALKGIGDAAFALMVPALAGYLAYSIADRPGLAPGFIGGMLAQQLNAGFLGGIAAGFLAGFVARTLRDRIRLPANLEGLKPVLVIPLLSALIVGLLMTYVIGAPVAALMGALTRFLTGMSGANAVLLGLLLGAMVAFDTGGPINKAAYAFAVGLLGSSTFTPMAAVMVAGMTPPLGLALATVVAKSRFTLQEREAGKAAAVLGLAFITEGAIPYAARDPLRVIPSIVFGSAIAGAVSMGFGCALRAPHGGVFVLAIPNAVAPLGPYVLALVAGTLATTLALVVLKRPLPTTP